MSDEKITKEIKADETRGDRTMPPPPKPEQTPPKAK